MKKCLSTHALKFILLTNDHSINVIVSIFYLFCTPLYMYTLCIEMIQYNYINTTHQICITTKKLHCDKSTVLQEI